MNSRLVPLSGRSTPTVLSYVLLVCLNWVFFYYRRHVIPFGQPDWENQSPMASCWSLSRRRNQARSTPSASLKSRTRRYIHWKLIVCQLPPISSANEGMLKLIHWTINCLYVSSLLFCLPMKECSNYLCISKHFSPITGIGLGQVFKMTCKIIFTSAPDPKPKQDCEFRCDTVPLH